MAEAIVSPVPSDTRLSEDLSSVWDDVKRYFHRNGDALWALTLTTTAILVNRSIVRRELKRLTFNVEIYPEDNIGDYGLQYTDDE